MKMMVMEMLLLLVMSVTSSQCSATATDDVQSGFNLGSSLQPGRDYILAMFFAVICGACIVAVLAALGHVVRVPALLSLRCASCNDQDPLHAPTFKLFDRIEEFH